MSYKQYMIGGIIVSHTIFIWICNIPIVFSVHTIHSSLIYAPTSSIFANPRANRWLLSKKKKIDLTFLSPFVTPCTESRCQGRRPSRAAPCMPPARVKLGRSIISDENWEVRRIPNLAAGEGHQELGRTGRHQLARTEMPRRLIPFISDVY